MTKIKFKKKKIYQNLIFGLLWVIIGMLGFLFSNGLALINFLWTGLGLCYLSFFIYDWKNQYLKIDNQTIQKNLLYGGWNKKLKLEDINAVEKTYLNYILKTDFDSLKTNADLIEEESYKEFKLILKGLNLPEDKIPALF